MTGTVTDMSLDEPTIISTVATHFPPFRPANPRIWFVQVEAQFSRRGITSSLSVYEDIVCALPTEYVTKVQDLLFDQSKNEPDEKLKDQLIGRLADSECQKLQQHLNPEELGDRSQHSCYKKWRCYLMKRRR